MTTEIRILRGYSASGKTTYANSLADTHTRVSRDDIRKMLTGRLEKFAGDGAFEKQVTQIERDLVTSLVKSGRSVVIDDTNLVLKFAQAWVTLANTLGVECDVQNFKPDLDLVLARNAARPFVERVPEDVIHKQARRHPYRTWEPVLPPVMEGHAAQQYVPVTYLPPCVTFDLDGTLALHSSGRNPYDTSRYMEDTPNEAVVRTLLAFRAQGYTIGILTGRDAAFREVCEDWLAENGILAVDFILMRPEGDKRSDGVIKKELFTQHIAPNYYHVMHFDDRNRVVQALRSIGVTVAQVAEGDF